MLKKIQSVPSGKSLFLSGKSLTILFLLISAQAYAQWQPDVRMTNNPGNSVLSDNNAWCIGSNPFIVCIVWADYRTGGDYIYYKRSSDGGVSWGPETQLSNTTNIGPGQPSIAVSGLLTPTVHVVWSELIPASPYDYEIYYRRSVGGLNWETSTRLTFAYDYSWFPSVAATGNNVHVVWADYRDWCDIYYKRSVDGGVIWQTDVKIVTPTNNFVPQKPSVSASGSDVHVIYYREVVEGNEEIFYKRSVDNGNSWGGEVRLTNANYNSLHPCVSVFGDVVHVVWNDSRDGNAEIYYKRSTNRGLNWGADVRLTNNPGGSGFPSVKSFSSAVHVVWYDNRDGNNEIYYKRSTNEGVNWEADTRLTNNSATSLHPSVSISLSNVHVVWEDNRDGNNEIYYKRNPTGNPVGIKNINSEIPKEFSLGQNYPNPFNPKSKIVYEIPKRSTVSIKLYNLLGQEVITLVNEIKEAGYYTVEFDGTNIASGVYFYRITADSYIAAKKLTIIK